MEQIIPIHEPATPQEIEDFEKLLANINANKELFKSDGHLLKSLTDRLNYSLSYNDNYVVMLHNYSTYYQKAVNLLCIKQCRVVDNMLRYTYYLEILQDNRPDDNKEGIYLLRSYSLNWYKLIINVSEDVYLAIKNKTFDNEQLDLLIRNNAQRQP